MLRLHNSNANIHKWAAYIKADASRQGYLERALDWVSRGNIEDYMSKHRFDDNITELKNYFYTVIDWVSRVFPDVEREMQNLEWARLYEEYKHTHYNFEKLGERVLELHADESVTAKRGIYEYVLSGESKPELLKLRLFEKSTKRTVYAQQTKIAKANKVSNCPLCALGHDANKEKIWNLTDMEADHVTAWSKGGATDISNCEMLCKTHNRAKGNS